MNSRSRRRSVPSPSSPKVWTLLPPWWPGSRIPEKSLEASDDGQNFRLVVKLPEGGAPQHTLSFAPVTAKFFRVTFKRTPPPPVPAWASGIDPEIAGDKDWRTSDRLRNCRIGAASGSARQPV